MGIYFINAKWLPSLVIELEAMLFADVISTEIPDVQKANISPAVAFPMLKSLKNYPKK